MRNTEACRQALYLTDPETDREALRITKGRRTDGTCEYVDKSGSFIPPLDCLGNCLDSRDSAPKYPKKDKGC
jgi:hypothetical protein